MRVIVCGSRDYTREIMIETILDGLYERYGDNLYVIEGDAKGADRIAGEWAQKRWPNADFRHHHSVPAEWYEHSEEWCPKWCKKDGPYCKGAGSRRNQQMLEILQEQDGPYLVIAFKDDFDFDLEKGGTEDMVKRAKEIGIPCFVVRKA